MIEIQGKASELRPVPPDALAGDERQAVLDALHAPRFADQAPAQVWATLLDEGTYLGSESTICRLLRTNGELRERRRQASHPPRTVPQLVAGRPNEVWSYDATALRGPSRSVSYDLFVMLDIFSRYSPGWLVADQESAHVVGAWIEQAVAAQGPIPAGSLTIHAGRGSSMPRSRWRSCSPISGSAGHTPARTSPTITPTPRPASRPSSTETQKIS